MNDSQDHREDSDGSRSGDEEYLIKPKKTSAIRRISSHCIHPTVACPTCKGKGKLSQAQSDTMLALIPMHDNRLRPRRTTLKLVLVFCFILVVGGLCFTFLFPRKVEISITDVYATGSSVNKTVVVNLTVTASVNNTNFFSVGISNITTEVLFLSTIDSTPHEVGLAVLKNTNHFGIRERKKLTLPVTTKYVGRDAERIRKVCQAHNRNKDEKFHYFPIRVSLTAKLQYWSHDEQIQSKNVYYIECQ